MCCGRSNIVRSQGLRATRYDNEHSATRAPWTLPRSRSGYVTPHMIYKDTAWRHEPVVGWRRNVGDPTEAVGSSGRSPGPQALTPYDAMPTGAGGVRDERH